MLRDERDGKEIGDSEALLYLIGYDRRRPLYFRNRENLVEWLMSAEGVKPVTKGQLAYEMKQAKKTWKQIEETIASPVNAAKNYARKNGKAWPIEL